MKKFLRRSDDLTIIVIISLVVSVASQFYFNAFTDSFRISVAVIVLPLLLMTIGQDVSAVKTCLTTAACIFMLRLFIHYGIYRSLDGAVDMYLPNAVFYIAYGFIFTLLCHNRHTASYRKMFVVIFVSDFLSNICEICVAAAGEDFKNTVEIVTALIGVAFVRGVITWLLLIGEKQYRTLLQKEEHENRYQRLFLMTTGLKNEIYFMKKNSEEIESVMGTAYKLYEHLNASDLPDHIKNMSLALAKDVHEIKKDYIRIIQGIEHEISEEYDEKQMKFSDILYILKDTTHHLLEAKNMNLILNFSCKDDFLTTEHYALMNIFKNLVTNAIEAMENAESGDSITLEQALVDGEFIFVVRDNGPGISKRHLPNIFKMGYSTKFDYVTGNIYRGVGLYGVKGTIEEQFGGSIEVHSVFGEGTQFTIKIPSDKIALGITENA